MTDPIIKRRIEWISNIKGAHYGDDDDSLAAVDILVCIAHWLDSKGIPHHTVADQAKGIYEAEKFNAEQGQKKLEGK